MIEERRPSVVHDRLKFFVRRVIAIRVAWDSKNDIVGELLDVLPLGRGYFLQLRVANRLQLVALDQVLSMAEPLA